MISKKQKTWPLEEALRENLKSTEAEETSRSGGESSNGGSPLLPKQSKDDLY